MELIKQPLARNDVPRSYAFVRKIRTGWPWAERETKKLRHRPSIFQAGALCPTSLSPQLFANGDAYREYQQPATKLSRNSATFMEHAPARPCLIR
jgi:hypothetical protein